jgi:Crp-like helix-turn-helix domain
MNTYMAWVGPTPLVNRMMQELRRQGLVTSKGKRLIVNDLEKLIEFADSTRTILHYPKNSER